MTPTRLSRCAHAPAPAGGSGQTRRGGVRKLRLGPVFRH